MNKYGKRGHAYGMIPLHLESAMCPQNFERNDAVEYLGRPPKDLRFP